MSAATSKVDVALAILFTVSSVVCMVLWVFDVKTTFDMMDRAVLMALVAWVSWRSVNEGRTSKNGRRS